MATNILAIPQPSTPLNIRTQSNTSWIDAFAIVIAGRAAGYAVSGNTGSGTITVTALDPTAAIGAHRVTIADATPNGVVATVHDPAGAITGIGAPGQPIMAGGITFTLAAGSPSLAVGDAFTINVAPTPLDITGIAFDLMVRTAPGDPTVALWATTRTAPGATGPIISGGAGGQVALNMPETVMARLRPGPYVYDIVATADGRRVLVAFGTLEHVRGVTIPII